MFKDYDKYLKVSLKVYLFVLIIIFIMKMVGIDYFGLDLNNPTLIKISDYFSTSHWGDLYFITTLTIQSYFYICLTTNRTKLYKESLILALILYIPQCLLNMFYKLDWIYPIWCLVVDLIFPMIINRKIKIKKQIIYIILMNLYQLISLFIRNVGVNSNYNNFLIDSLLNIDQLLLFAITYNLYFMKGGNKLCGVELDQCSSLLKQLNYKKLLKKLQKNLYNFKKLDKEAKLTFIIYFILSLFWNMVTVLIVLLVAKLNDTFIECIFIITSFWISKGKFGKAFHLKSMAQCFIVSNLSYYILNRITTPLGISIIVPILLGVGLSYLTSKLVKKEYKPLYRGMPEELFNETILKVTDKDSEKYNVCYDFYIKKKSTISLAIKYNYSEAGIRKIKDRINNKIKEL